ncbi:MAG TPA: HlyD family efflux transporter periplasmic adaptor subunit [Polyangiaceae bacterium]|nr:HlyD family efflux transporter periplasmic adaptor subunit [Polyangiaceae bacterium]
MIKNAPSWLLLFLAAGCSTAENGERQAFQGVVELEERDVAFELPGRLKLVKVARGDQVKSGELLASIDESMESAAKGVREAEVGAAQAEVKRVKAGNRSEEIRAAQAQVRAAKAREALLKRNLERERSLAARNITPKSAVYDLQDQLAGAKAEREALEQKAKGLARGARSSDVDSVESRADVAQQAVLLENQRLLRHSLRAPIDGTVLDVHKDPGEVVGTGMPVVTLGDVRSPYADVFVPIGKLEGVKLGAVGSVKVDSQAQPFAAKVEHISRRTEFTPRFLFSEQERPSLVVRVRMRIEDPEQKLHAGVPAFVSLESAP